MKALYLPFISSRTNAIVGEGQMVQVTQAQEEQKVPQVEHVDLKSIFSSNDLLSRNQWHKESRVWNRKSRIENLESLMNCLQNGRCVNSKVWNQSATERRALSKRFKTTEIPIWTNYFCL